MGFKDDIKELLSKKKKTPEQSDDSEKKKKKADDEAAALAKKKADDEAAGKEAGTFTKKDVKKMLKKQREEIEGEVKTMLADFTGDGDPQVGGPAGPTESSSNFDAWNKEIKKIEKKNQS